MRHLAKTLLLISVAIACPSPGLTQESRQPQKASDKREQKQAERAQKRKEKEEAQLQQQQAGVRCTRLRRKP